MHKLLSVSLLTAVAGIRVLYACPFCEGKKQDVLLALDTQRDLDEDIDMNDMDMDDDDEDLDDMDIDDDSDLESAIDDEDEQR